MRNDRHVAEVTLTVVPAVTGFDLRRVSGNEYLRPLGSRFVEVIFVG